MMVGKVLAIIVAGALALGVAACGDDSGGAAAGGSGGDSPLAKLKQSGEVRLGVAEALPTTAANESEPEGLVPEVTAMVFNKMGVAKAVPVPMDFGALIPSLQSGRIDVASGGFYITPDRCEAITLSEPLFDYYDAFAVPKGNPHSITTYKDIADQGLKMGSVAGAANVELAEQAGVKKSDISEYNDIPSLLDALKAGRIDAAPYDNVTIAYEVGLPAYSSLDASEPTAPIVDGKEQPYAVSVGFRKDAGDIATEFDKVAAQMLAAGDFDPILQKYSLPPETKRPAGSLNVAGLCAQ